MHPDLLKAAALWQRAAIAQMEMMTSAAFVIQNRMLQMGLGTMRPDEAMRMVWEKPAAFAKAHERAMRAAAGSKGHAAAALAAIEPVGATTRANAKRLSPAKTPARRKPTRPRRPKRS